MTARSLRRFWRDEVRKDGRWIRLSPKEAAWWSLRGSSRVRAGQPNAALRDLDRALLLDPSNSDAHFNRGNAPFDLERYAEAIEAYGRSIDFDLETGSERMSRSICVVAHYDRGLVYRQLDERDRALADYGATLTLDPDYVDALNNRGNLLNALGRPQDALNDLDRGVALAPRDPEMHANRAHALLLLDRAGEALEACDRALAVDPRHAVALYDKTCALSLLGRLDEADYWLRRAVQRGGGLAAFADEDADLKPLRALSNDGLPTDRTAIAS